MTKTPLALLLAAAVLFAQETEEPAKPDVSAELEAAQEKQKAGDRDGAIAAYTAVLEKDPDHLGAVLNRGHLRLQGGDAAGALADFEKASELKPEDPSMPRRRSSAKQALFDFDGALADLDKSWEMQQNPNVMFDRALVKARMGDYAGALADFDTVASLAAGVPAVFHHRGRMKRYAGDFDGALKDLDEAVYLEENDSGHYLERAEVKAAQGDLAGSKKDLSKALEIDPGSGHVYYVRGFLRFDRGEYEKALEDWERALTMGRGDRFEYARLYRALAKARLGKGEEGAAALGAYLDEREKKDDWFVKVASFLSGRLPEEEFLAAAVSEKKYEAREHLCEAYWYAASRRLAKGDAEGAKPLLEKCVATDVRMFLEFQSAKAELARQAK